MTSSEIPEFLFPRRLSSRRGASRQVGAELIADGVEAGPVLVATDTMLHSLGLTSSLLDGLREAGFEPRLFDGVAGEPDDESILAGVSAAGAGSVQAVIGIGGGSALDTAKLIALATCSTIALDELKGPVAAVAGFPPLVLIPTTVGTGAEATRIAMFSVGGRKRAVTSRQFVPSLAVLDPQLVENLPPAIIAATALDALSHAIESMLSTTSNRLTEHFAAESAKIVLARLPDAVENSHAGAIEDLLYASFLGGVALNAGVVLGHSLSYMLAVQHHVPHGVGCALSLPYCLAYNQGMDAQRGSAIASAILGRPKATLRELAEAVEALTRRVGLPTAISELQGEPGDPAALANLIVLEYPRPTNPIPLDVGRLSLLISHMGDGDLMGAWKAMER